MKVLLASGVLSVVSFGIALKTMPNVDAHGFALQTALTDLANLKAAVEFYRRDNGVLPPPDTGLNALLPVENPASASRHGYLDQLPVDPWHMPYIYRHNSPAGVFSIYSFGPNRRDESEQGDDVALDKKDYACKSFNDCPTFTDRVSDVATVMTLAAVLVFIGTLVRTVWLTVRRKKAAPPTGI